MRRLLLGVAALMPLTVFVGCQHMAGKCDCVHKPAIDCPCAAQTIVAAPPLAAPVKPPEPIKEAPKPKTDTPDK